MTCTIRYGQQTKAQQSQRLVLRLYVAGRSPKSLRAVANLTRVCETHLQSRYEIEIVDLIEHPQLAAVDQIIAIATLVPQASRTDPHDYR